MTLPFPRPATLPPGFTLSRCAPADAPGMTSVWSLSTSRRPDALTRGNNFGYLVKHKLTFHPRNMDAFTDTPYTYWWAPLEAMRQWNEERILRRFRDPKTQQFKVVDDATGQIVSWAKWDPPAAMEGLREGFLTYEANGKETRPEHGENAKAKAKEVGDGAAERRETREGESAAGKKAKAGLGPPQGANEVLFREFFDDLVHMEEKWGASDKLALTHLCTSPAYHGRGIGAAILRAVLEVADAEGVPAYLESLHPATPLYQRHGFVIVDELGYDLGRAGKEGTAVINIMLREPRPGPRWD